MKGHWGGGIRDAFGYEGAFYTYTGKIFDLMLASVLWLLGSLPIVTIGAANSALYASVSRCVRMDIGEVPAQFWKSYRRGTAVPGFEKFPAHMDWLWGGCFPSFAEHWHYQEQGRRAGRNILCDVLWISYAFAGDSRLLCVSGLIQI